MKLLLAIVLLAAALASAGPLDHPIFSFFNMFEAFPGAECVDCRASICPNCRVWNAAGIHSAITAMTTM
jgi:hypothetical protein